MSQPPDRDKPPAPVMTTVEIKSKQPEDTPKIETESTDKENIKKIKDENEALKTIDLKKKDDVIGDGPRNDKIFNNVSIFSLYNSTLIRLFLLSLIVNFFISSIDLLVWKLDEGQKLLVCDKDKYCKVSLKYVLILNSRVWLEMKRIIQLPNENYWSS